ncbi:MAG: hypothetical protein IIZ78_18240 [Clostridiales bacterium]|nr:hypothetical protein [Clostridiales bacterium]MBQ1573075.1 hypothetical protein [Clostridiales bacterium]
MARLKGITVTLYTETITGYDSLGNPVIETKEESVDNVLVGEPSTDDITTSLSMYGKQISFMLGIPKGDTHDWMDKEVSWTDAYGITRKVKTFGYPITGIEENLPPQIPWHMKVRCEAYG